MKSLSRRVLDTRIRVGRLSLSCRKALIFAFNETFDSRLPVA